MDKQEIQEKVNAFLTDRLEYDPEAVVPNAELKRDLGMSSLDTVETSLFVKRTFGVQPERGAIKALITLQDLYDYIEANIAK